MDMSFYKDKSVLVTGHTGFKGSWLCKILINAGAKVSGYALETSTVPSLFNMCHLAEHMNSVIGDIRDLEHLNKVFDETKPQIVIHMAAQPIVRDSYREPVYTYSVNVMGTVNVLECIRNSNTVKSFVNVTTDKVYLNREWEWGYREDEELNGFDPYSNSKSCSELVTSSYKNSFFENREVAISTARAGNVIGGGDFANDRIIPDCIRAAEQGKKIVVRNPFSIRPYQHVLDPVYVYLMLAKEQYENKEFAGNYNIGPDDRDCRTTGELVTLFCKQWNKTMGGNITWENIYDGGPHEANFLKLDCSRLRSAFHWKPGWDVETAIDKIVEWTQVSLMGGDVAACMDNQIYEFLKVQHI